MARGIVDKSIDLDELLKKESSGGAQGDFAQKLSDAYALVFNTLQELKEMKARGDFKTLKETKRELYDSVMKCKVTVDELKEFLDFLGEGGEAGEKPERRRYRR
ncbi:MAG: hypothetical protein QXR53_01545 [Candidatus Norongarragalinales archaeon]